MELFYTTMALPTAKRLSPYLLRPGCQLAGSSILQEASRELSAMLAVSGWRRAVKTLHLADDEELHRGCGSHQLQAASPESPPFSRPTAPPPQPCRLRSPTLSPMGHARAHPEHTQ